MESLYGESTTSTDSGVTKKSKYDMDALFGPRSEENKVLESRVKLNISEAVKQDPLQVFKSKTLSQSLGLPQDVTFRNLKEVEANAKSKEWESAIANSPTLKRLTADPYFAGVSFKDDALPEVEKLFREKGFAAASERRNKAIQDRKTMLSEAMKGYKEDTASTLGSIGAGLAIDLPSGIVYGGGAAIFETAGEWLDRTGLIGTLLPANPLSMAGEKFRELGNRAKATADALSGETNSTSPVVQGWYSGWRSFGSNAPALVGSVLTRNPKLALESLTAMVGGQEYLKAREEGKAPTESAAFATSQALIERATEGIPLDTLFRNLRSGKGALNTFAVNQVQEQIGEQAATVLQDLNDWAFLNPQKTFKEYLAERPNAAAQTAVATLVGGGAQTIIAQAVENTGNFLSTKQEKARFAEDNAKAMEQLFAFANTSALKGIDAKSFEQLVQASADDNDGTPSELYIDGRVFKQLADEAGVDLTTMPTIAAQIEDAIANQTDIVAPIGELTVGMANTGLESQIIENLKYEDDGLTIGESRIVFEQSKEMFKAEVDRTLATQEEKNFFEQKADEIYQNIFTQLQEVKRNTKDANDVYAELIKQFYSTEAKQQSAAAGTVVTPDMAFASLPAFKVVGESPITGKVYDQEATEFKSWFGNSKAVDDSGNPLVVYHGSEAKDIKKFKTGNRGLIYVTQDKGYAEAYTNDDGRVYELNVKIENPASYLDDKVMQVLLEENKDLNRDDIVEAFEAGYDPYEIFEKKSVIKKLKSLGYDGFVFEEEGQTSIGVFSADQLREAKSLLNQDAAPIFYSALYQGIETTNLKDMPASQWKSWLAGNSAKLGIKKEEVEWTGLNEYFDLRGKDKLSKQDVLAYIESNGVKVEEITLGLDTGINMNSQYAEIPEVMRLVRENQGSAEDALRIALENDYDAYQALTARVPALMEIDNWAEQVALDLTGGLGSFDTATRYSDWQLADGAGAKNYRELLLKLPTEVESLEARYQDIKAKLQKVWDMGAESPDLEQKATDVMNKLNALYSKNVTFKSSHWDQRNIVAHIRFNERIDSEGKRVLFIEEIQSDWAQKGRKEGFRGADVTADAIDIRWVDPNIPEGHDPKNYMGYWEVFDRASNEFILRDSGRYTKEEIEIRALKALNTDFFRGHPTAAYVTETKSWTTLAVKRMMRYAADNGYDKVAFINGEQSAERYNLSKQLDAIGWDSDEKYKYIQLIGLKGVSNQNLEITVSKETGKVFSMDMGSPEEWKNKPLSELIGKEVADKIMQSEKGDINKEGLKIGGRGMIAYYDQIVPSVVNEQLKKVGGGKLGNVSFGTGGLTYDDIQTMLQDFETYPAGSQERQDLRALQESAPDSKTELAGNQLGFEVTDAMREQILKGLPLFQGGGTQALGTFDPDQFIITLKQNANLSTFLHEIGHFFLEAKVKLATQEGARQQLKDDVNALMQWFGTDLGTWQRMSLDEKRQSHEKFARGFEAYLFEGNAPSTELRSAFQRFSDWLKNIYVSISKLLSDNNVQLTPEVRAVMDRMLATDEQIEEAKRRRDVMALFNTKEEADMTAAEFFDYQAQLYQVTQEAKEKMAKRSLADIKYLRRAHDKYVRNFQKEGEEKRREARMEARAEVMSQPLYRAWSFLSAKDWGKVSAKEKQSKLIDPTRDSLFVAIAKLGGINRDLIISEFGLDIADIKGNPAFKAKGGMTVDGMVENLSQYGYIQTDDSGKYWLADFEDMVMDELAGSLQYSIAYNYEADQQDIVEGQQFDLAQQLPAGRLSLDEVKAIYGQNFDAVREKLGRMLASDGLMIDVVADLFKNEDGSTAFGSGKELIDAMMAALPPQLAIEDLTDKIVMERYGDITSEDAAKKAADEALHNEAMLRSAATEMKAISGMQGSIRDLTRAAKEAADEAIRKVKVRDLRPNKYITAAQKAGRAADAAVKAKNPQEAAAAKRLQMINLAMVQRAYAAQAEMRQAMKAFAAVNKADKKLAKTMDINLVETARSVLASFGLNNADPRLAMENLDKVKAYNPDLYAVLEPNVRMATMTARDENNNAVNYKQLSIAEFFALRDTVAQLTQQAREEKKITRKGVGIELEQVNAMLTEQLLANGYKVSEVGKSIAPTEKDQRKWTVSSIKAAMRRMEHWVSMQDNNDFNGAFRSFLFQEVQDANTQYMTVKNIKLRQYVDMLRKKEIEGNFTAGKIAATEIGYTFTGKQELLGALLHTGNESNKRKLLVGRNWGELVEGADKKRTLDTSRWDAFISRAISEGTITKSDYDFIQATWDLMESIKPDAQKAHYKLYGYYFDEITANAFETPFGTYRGGYAPAKADSNLVLEADIRQDINQLENDFNYMMPSTGNGFTQGRVEYNKPLVMDLRLVAQHLDQVLRFTYIQPAINDVLKIVKRGEFANTLNAVDKGALKSMIMPWLQRVATQTTSAPFQSDAGKKTAKFWQGLRRNTGMNIMTANMVNALQQVTGISMAAVKVEPKYLKSAQVRYMMAPNETGNSIALLSDWMKIRLENQAFDMQTQMQEIMMGESKVGKAKNFIQSHAYFMQRAMQNYVDIVTWSAAYDKAISEGTLDEQDAIKYADSVVRETQSSLLPVDISTLEAGNAFTQLFTQFTNYFNMQANLLGTNFAVNQRQNGFSRKGMGKMFYIYVMGFMIPAVFADAIVRTFGWDWDDEDDDGYLDEFMAWFFGSQARTATAMIPFVGMVANATLNKFNDKFYDDRITTSPAVSMLDQATAAPKSIYDAIFDEGSVKKAIKDSLSFAGLVSGVPLAALGRPAGYIVDWVENEVEPENALDAIRGLVSGRGREEERQ